MPEGFDILVGQQLGELIAPVDRQDPGDGVQLNGAPFDACPEALSFGLLVAKAAV